MAVAYPELVENTQQYTEVGEDVAVLGDCWRSCVASVLGMPSVDVPHFIDDTRHDAAGAWRAATEQWLANRSMSLVWLGRLPLFGGPRYAIATGPSPRGDWLHAVILDARTSALVWDPHPSRDGLAGAITDLCAIFAEEVAA